MFNVILLASIGSQGGWTVALVGYSIVFAALVLLITIFTTLPKLISMKVRSELRRKGKHVTDTEEDLHIKGDETAAISMALHLYFSEMHDDESNVITISRIQRRYSPWSSKIYSIYNSPLK
ncbi:MAG: OadG family protein [Salinivirgaceae bacterium]|jgi:Na+-transporting methylmalonyl-CoA/oxaloacetate decarboxylase gamma subunit|nr:OadG family protein [Salinivirgaceae bacterium]